MQFWKFRDRRVTTDPAHIDYVHTDAASADQRRVRTDSYVDHVEPDRGPTDADVREAYKKGRHDEKARRKSHPILALIVFVLAVIGGVMVFLAIRNGSFSGAGQVADRNLAVAAAEGPGVVRNAAGEVVETVREARAEEPAPSQ